eukprot:8923930-Alexandrium_andersonii.AAC.1
MIGRGLHHPREHELADLGVVAGVALVDVDFHHHGAVPQLFLRHSRRVGRGTGSTAVQLMNL